MRALFDKSGKFLRDDTTMNRVYG